MFKQNLFALVNTLVDNDIPKNDDAVEFKAHFPYSEESLNFISHYFELAQRANTFTVMTGMLVKVFTPKGLILNTRVKSGIKYLSFINGKTTNADTLVELSRTQRIKGALWKSELPKYSAITSFKSTDLNFKEAMRGVYDQSPGVNQDFKKGLVEVTLFIDRNWE